MLGRICARRAPSHCHVAGADVITCSMLSTLHFGDDRGSQDVVRLSCSWSFWSPFPELLQGHFATQPYSIAVCCAVASNLNDANQAVL